MAALLYGWSFEERNYTEIDYGFGMIYGVCLFMFLWTNLGRVILGGKIDKECCLYPAGADPFMPEPDLVRMGDGCVIDCASIVCHLNTRGNFDLQKIVIEDNCTLRTGSRVQQGVHMEQGSQLLEKSVAMTGEVIEAFSAWRGVPAFCWFHQYPDDDDDESTTSDASSIWQGTRLW